MITECKNKRVIQKCVTPEQFQHENDHLYKWYTIEFLQARDEEPDIWLRHEYHDKYDVQRLLDAQTTIHARITIMEGVDNE